MDATPDFDAISNDELVDSLTSLSARINAATFEQLMLIAEFDKRRVWGIEGSRSCAHWLNWRCGLSLNAAREKLRVAHALQELPKTRKAFATGQLSYSKARAITRVANTDNESCLLSYARYGSAQHLDRTVRLYRRQFVNPDPIYSPDPIDPNTPAVQHHLDSRELSTYWDDQGCLVIRARLPAEQGAVFLKALECAVDDMGREETENTPAGVSATHRRADALERIAESSLQNSKTSANTGDRYQVVVHVGHDVLAETSPSQPAGKPDCYIENQVGLPVETARRISCCSKLVTAVTKGSEPLSIGRSSRAIPTAIQRALAIRDGHCQFPGCGCDKHLDAHHIVHWSNGGDTALDNLVLLCHHHHTCLHEGGYRMERHAETGQLSFYQPDGSWIDPSTDWRESDGALPQSVGLGWQWNGDVMDYGIAVDAIHYRTSKLPPPP